MKKIFLLLIFVATTIIGIYPQEQLIDLEGVFKGKYKLDDLQNLSWRPDTEQYSFVKDDNIVLVSAKTDKEETFLTFSRLEKLLPASSFNRFPSYTWISENELYFPSLKIILTKDKENWSVEDDLPTSVIDRQLMHRLFVAKEEDGNVYVYSIKNGYQRILLCPDTGKNIQFGEAVHRHEWGIEEGQYFSPNGNFIAFYRMDESQVKDYPLVNTSPLMAEVKLIKYPMAGQKSHQVTVGIFDVDSSTKVNVPIYHYIKTDLEDGEFLTNITFSPDEKYLFINHLNRAQNHAKLIKYDVKTGEKIAVLWEERDSRYVEPSSRPLFLKNGNLILQSNRDGWNHFYLHDKDGKLIKQLTKGDWEVIESLGVDSEEKFLFFVTNRSNPTNREVYSLNLKNGKLLNLTPELGTHSLQFSSNKQYFVDYFQNLKTPRLIELGSSDGKIKKELLRAENPYKNCLQWQDSIFSIQNQQGIELYCRMIYPPNFNPTSSYPCLIYVYGGPHSQMVTNTFMSGGVFLHYLAQKGYVIFTLDNRGTAYRGAEFEKCIHRQLGVLEVEDQILGINYLKCLPFVDTTRLGLDGWSYGGFMILTLISTYPDLFKSASCGGPVVDWRKYEVMYGERYMDTPEENPIGYEQADILPKVSNIKSELLVMHGAQDPTVVWQHSLELLRQAVEDGIQLDYFVYPAHEHNVRGIERVHLWNKIEKFHHQHLLP